MPYGKLTTNNFAAWNYFLFTGIKIRLARGTRCSLALRKFTQAKKIAFA